MRAPELERRTESAKGFNRPEAAAALRRGRFASRKQTLARVIKSRKKVVWGMLVALGVHLSWRPPPPGSVTPVVFFRYCKALSRSPGVHHGLSAVGFVSQGGF